MGQSQIEIKISAELNKDIVNELQVVYILSRVRKLLEIKKLKSKYPILNFYCNWALHSEVTKTDGKEINTILREFIQKPEEKYKLSFHSQFTDQLMDFLKNHQLPILRGEKLDNFVYQLGKVISDTPIEVTIGTRYKITFKEPLCVQQSGLHITEIV